MADDSWKHARGSAPKRPAASRRSWQPGQSAVPAADPNRRARRSRLAAGFVGALLVSGVVLAIILWRPTKAARFVVVSPNVPTATVSPLNAAGHQSSVALAEWAAQHPEIPGPKPKTDAGVTAENWEAAIDRADTGKTPLVLTFTAPGGADASGPFLWMVPDKVAVAGQGHRLPVAKILDVLKTLPAERHKVLIFDAAFEPVNWSRGEFSNEFARGLKALDAKIAGIDRLVVICSADADQTAWVSEEWRESVFGHFVVEGLRGGAVKNDHHITAAALFDYLKDRVGGWAQANRDAAQKPMLLPAEDGPRRAGEIRLLSVDASKYRPTDVGEAPGLSADAPADLRGIWDRTAELSARQPRPEAAAPHLWRQYLDLALRCEKLARDTGSVPAAGLAHLAKLDRELTQTPWNRTPECLTNAFPVPRAMGQPAVKLPAGTLDKLLALPPADQTKEWDKQAGPRDAAASALAAELLDRLSKQATVSPADIDAAIALLKQLDAVRDRQAEVQLLRILHAERDRPMAAGADIALALRVHMAGERAAWFVTPGAEYTYPEQVARWLAEPLAAADHLRRTGIDMLFSSAEADWKNGRDRLTAAATQYDELQTATAKLATAYRVRDELQTRLPYYAFWAANQRTPAANTDAVLTSAEDIAKQFHDLARALVEPTPARLPDIHRLTAQLDPANVTGAYAGVVKRVQQEADELAQSTTQLPSDWHRLDNALRVPFVPPAQRAVLYRRLKSTSGKLHTATTSQNAAPTESSSRLLAMRHARLALAVLGAGLTDELKPSGAPSWTQLGPKVATADAEQWPRALGDVGEQVAAVCRALPVFTAQSLSDASRANGDAAKRELAKACRYAAACDGALLPGENPVAAGRRVWMHDLLLAHAKRSMTDGWAEVDAGAAKPYCRRAADAYAQTAEDIIVNGEPLDTVTKEKRLADAAAVRAKLTPPKFTLAWEDGSLYVTDRAEEKPKLRITSQNAAGFPALRVTVVSKPLSSGQYPVGKGIAVAGFEKADAEPALVPIPLQVDRASAADKAAGQVDAELFFRGAKAGAKLTSQSFGTPTYTWIHRTPKDDRAMISVSGDESLMSGSTVILFDASLSMKQLGPGQTDTKLFLAAGAVRELLAKLPSDSYVTVILMAGDGARAYTPRVLLEPTAWNTPDAHAKRVYDRLLAAENEPYGRSSPIAAAVVDTLDEDGIKKYFRAGSKNLLVISDGEDNVAGADAGADVLSFLTNPAKFPDDVAVHLLLFGTTADDEATARAQFAAMTNEARYQETRTPAEIWPKEAKAARLRSTADLAVALREAMIPRVQLLDKDGKRAGRVPVSLAESYANLPPTRGLTPGLYTLRTADELLPLYLQPADRLALRLKREGGKLALTLPSYADLKRADLPADADTKSAPVRMTAAMTRRVVLDGRDDAELLVTLEKPSANRADHLRRELPQFAWFDVTAADADAAPAGLRVENVFDRIAPAWLVTAHKWVPRKGRTEVAIAPAPPQIDGYWLDRWPDQEGKATREFESLNRLPKAAEKFGVQGVGEITLESIAVEGKYLAVRLRHPKGSPVVCRAVKLLGQDQRWHLEEEHRWYGPAGVYVARFGPLPEDLARPLTLDVYSVDAIKRTATRLELTPKDALEINSRDLLPKRALPNN